MSTWLKRCVACGVAVLMVAGAALAAAPTKNGLYIGKLTGRGLEKRIELHVAKSGKTATAGLWCANTPASKMKPFPITKGRFDASKKIGSTTVWRLRGKFVSSKSIAAGLLLPSVCDGVGGSLRINLSSS
jgi:hypothetical protein